MTVVATRHKAIRDFESMKLLYHEGSMFVFVLIVGDGWLSSARMKRLVFKRGIIPKGVESARRISLVAKKAVDLKRGFDRTC